MKAVDLVDMRNTASDFVTQADALLSEQTKASVFRNTRVASSVRKLASELSKQSVVLRRPEPWKEGA